MHQCDHKAWVEVHSDGASKSIVYNDRLGHLRRGLDSPHRQSPSVALFLGKACKDKVLRSLFAKDFPPRRTSSGINIHLDRRTRTSQYPLYFAEFDPDDDDLCGSHSPQPNCHLHHTTPISWTGEQDATTVDNVAARLLLPFVDLVCVFANDVGGPSAASALLRRWAQLGHHAHTLPSGGAHVILVADEVNLPTDVTALQQEEAFSSTFRSIKTHKISTRDRGAFYEQVSDCLALSRNERQRRRLLFSAAHQGSLFCSAVTHCAKSIREPFDLLGATRVTSTGLGKDFVAHVKHVSDIAKRADVPFHDVKVVMASALSLDAVSREPHFFDPSYVFEKLYRQTLFFALSQILRDPSEAAKACEDVRSHFHACYEECFSTGHPVREVHQRTLKTTMKIWSKMRSTSTCLVCLKFPPEHVLQCAHSLCEACLRSSAVDVSSHVGALDSMVLETCPICQHGPRFTVRLKPLTAGVRVLSIDGGGIKGIIPLETLSLMQASLGADCPIQEMFDLCIGTSAGGLIVLNIFLRNFSVAQTLNTFKEMSRKIFSARPAAQQAFTAILTRIMKTLSRDELYDSGLLDEALVEQFGAHKIFGYNPAMQLGTRVGVIATATNSNTSTPTRIFSNYNGVGPRQKDCRYRLQRSEETRKEALVWQAARATSAAPIYFRPAVTSFGVFQDGCMSAQNNNPTEIALLESRVIWPSVPRPDVVLSLGTGNCQIAPSPTVDSPKLSLRDAFPFRIARSFWSSMDGQLIWGNLLGRLDDDVRQNFFRLSLEYHGPEAAMDDHGAMEMLAQAVTVQPSGEADRQKVLMALLTACLFFELDTQPVYIAGRFHCEGSIRCRSSQALKSMLRLYPHGLEFFIGALSLASFVDLKDLCAGCSRYRKVVRFSTTSMDEDLKLCIKWDGLAQSRYISGMPRQLAWFTSVQGFGDAFGHTALRWSPRESCPSCTTTRTVKQPLDESSDEKLAKKVRFNRDRPSRHKTLT